MLLVYSHSLTPRLRYATGALLGTMLGLEHRLTDKKDEFLAFEGAKFSYTFSAMGNEPHFQCSRLLFERGLTEHDIQVGTYKGINVLIPVSQSNSALPFDPFAAAFFMLSRYEEYMPHIRDHYNRFEATESLAYRHGFLQVPVVDHWALMVYEVLKQCYPNLPGHNRSYRFINTIDIDNAYAYRLKGVARTFGAMARDVTTADFATLRNRIKVLLGKQTDPYDTYDLMLELIKKHKVPTLIFFLLGDYGVNDKNIAHNNPLFGNLIRQLADHAEVGIHPSFGSNSQPDNVGKEKARLEAITHRKVTASRQHFLVLHMPTTYRRLLQVGIRHDHSMGYAASTGFRAGTCTPFKFYDVDMEQETPLTIHPFAVMDATLRHYMQVSPAEAEANVTELVARVKAVQGTFISLWHNETISDQGIWAGWQRVYHHVMAVASA